MFPDGVWTCRLYACFLLLILLIQIPNRMLNMDNAAVIALKTSITKVLFIVFWASVDCVASIVILAFVGFVVLGLSWAFGIGVADVVGVIGTDKTITSALIMVRFLC
jgi:hypothetical protein